MEPSDIPEADVEIVAARAGVSGDEARRALATVDGDLAGAVDLAEAGAIPDASADRSGSVRRDVPEVDVELVAARTDVDRRRARRALRRVDGDLAAAVDLLESDADRSGSRDGGTGSDQTAGGTEVDTDGQRGGDTRVYEDGGAEERDDSGTAPSFCPACGSDLSAHADAAYCPDCGSSL
jgi:NACalpha-BTF3-like transcription factor